MNSIGQAQTILKTEGLTKIFGTGDTAVHAVDHVDLEVRAGEIVLIMGPSGSGKTTLLSMIGGLLRPTDGRVIVDGVAITALAEHQMAPVRRRLVGFVFQSFNLWEALSVAENVELALNMNGVNGHEARGRARVLLDRLGLEHRLRFPTRALSGGEKQRVSIARALANEPRLLLADEPTANLDSKHGRDVMSLLRDLARQGDRAVIVVSHDHRLREVADRVLWLEDGRLADMSRLAEDPVCRMSVEVDRAVAVTHVGRTFYFCSRGCSQEFAESPERFLSSAAGQA